MRPLLHHSLSFLLVSQAAGTVSGTPACPDWRVLSATTWNEPAAMVRRGLQTARAVSCALTIGIFARIKRKGRRMAGGRESTGHRVMHSTGMKAQRATNWKSTCIDQRSRLIFSTVRQCQVWNRIVRRFEDSCDALLSCWIIVYSRRLSLSYGMRAGKPVLVARLPQIHFAVWRPYGYLAAVNLLTSATSVYVHTNSSPPVSVQLLSLPVRERALCHGLTTS